jgi:outer membrane lipoprotein SlyB
MNPNTGKSNPIYVIAAIAVIVLSVVGVAAFTGLIPNTFSKSQPTELMTPAAPDPVATAALQPAPVAPPAPAVAAAPPPIVEEKAPAPKPKPKPVAKKPVPKYVEPEHMAVNEPPPAPRFCHDCGVIESVNTIKVPGQGKGVLGAIAGGVIGGVLGHQVGSGRGNDVATAAGAIGGAVAGNQIEKSVNKKVEYDVVVRLEDNTAQTVHFQTDPGFQIGERVKLVDGQIVRN